MTPYTLPPKSLGTLGRVSAIGLGLMGMSAMYGPADRDESIATIRAAHDAGVTFFDTGDFYGMGHNELLLREAMQGIGRDSVQISVKYGALRSPDGRWIGADTSPAATKTWLAYSLQRLGTDYVDVYRPARLDPKVPIEDTIGAIAEMVSSGHVRHIGLSEVGSETIRRAHAVHPISDLQIEYAVVSRGIESDILQTCRELGIGVTAYGVLARGLISGHYDPSKAVVGDLRGHTPRFQAENLDRNLAGVEALRSVAEQNGVTVAQAAIAWVASRGDDILPLVGARTRERLSESLGAAHLTLSDEQLEAIENAFPAGQIAGSRYDAAQMATLDSER